MRCDIVTLFPAAVEAYLAVGVLGRAVATGRLQVRVHDLRRWAINRYGQVDDEPFGGGPGMVLLAPVVTAAARELQARGGPARLIVPDPRGRRFTDQVARELARLPRLLLISGRYEGIDERVFAVLEADAISLGDFVLSGGELPCLAIVDAVARCLPGVVGDPRSVVEDSFAGGLLDHPVYTRPRVFEGVEVPAVLLSGDHEAVRRFRLEQAVRTTLARRPDLVLANWERLSAEARELVRRLAAEFDVRPPE